MRRWRVRAFAGAHRFIGVHVLHAWRACAALALCCAMQHTLAADLKLYAAAGVKAPLERIARDFEASGGGHVTLVFDTAGGAEERFLADRGASALVTSAVRVHAAQDAGRLRDGATAVIGATVGGLAVPRGAVKPDISDARHLRDALLAAPRIALSDPARGATVGRHFLGVIEALGIRDAVMKKVVLAPNGVETMRLVEEGRADLGVTQISEILQADPACLLGPFAAPYDLATDYALWMPADAPAAMRAFAALATSPAERARLRADGLRPPE
ncbi:molybdate ABC transporter substrate-binding protein [Noviherbaspirillum pedocola]|uniref:Substrate-binding domain-containing protein n=1 Tax=Noviherbaspirillum pedocola TaxID=2801341 RepID=A0A934T411_9BURK|nr:substrate-binding domain-containing protein [Noviherbaspirillum pedocola]MBK4738413.1 substrate-binding domain-containing protein [Noviherbaspirillum pedocola]